MLKNLLMCYDPNLSRDLKRKFDEDFVHADKVVLTTIIAYAVIVSFLTSLQNGYYVLGIVGGGLVAGISFIAVKAFAGTLMSRLILATALTAMMAITIQQSNGLGEGHFLFFLNFTILIRYRDITPLITLVAATVLHHITLTYCQSIGVEAFGEPLIIFSWGGQTDLGLLAPLIYHVVIAVLGAVIATYYIYEGNTKFLEANCVILAVEKAADGDLTARADTMVKTSLVNDVNDFFERLSSFMRSTNNTANSLTDLAEEEASSAEERHQQAQKQQEQVIMVATSVHEMSSATQEIARNAEQTAASIGAAAETSEEGRKLAQSFNQSIHKLADNVSHASQRIGELEQSSSQIHGIVSSIRAISEQTNLLALNAAIEAARAGEQGRGFAVVADEVRVLSQRTHTSTEEIGKMVDAFQASTSAAVETMVECSKLSESSVKDATEAANNFDEIAGSMSQINDMATQIATAAEEQTVVTEDINKNTTYIREVSDLFLDGARKSAEEAEDLRKLALEIATNLGRYRV